MNNCGVTGCAQGFGLQTPPAVHVPVQSACAVTEQVPAAAQHDPVGVPPPPPAGGQPVPSKNGEVAPKKITAVMSLFRPVICIPLKLHSSVHCIQREVRQSGTIAFAISTKAIVPCSNVFYSTRKT